MKQSRSETTIFSLLCFSSAFKKIDFSNNQKKKLYEQYIEFNSTRTEILHKITKRDYKSNVNTQLWLNMLLVHYYV